MTRYDVHAFAVVRVTVRGIEASDYCDAIQRAEARMDFYRILRQLDSVAETDFADEVQGFLVDVADDRSYERSRYFESSGDFSST